MTDNNLSKRRIGIKARFAFLRNSISLILVWPVACVILSGLLWGATLLKLDKDTRAFEKNTLNDASKIASAYAQQLTRAIEQADQITRIVKYDWERSHGTLKLEDLLQHGIFPISQHVFVSIIDRSGTPISRTLPTTGRLNVADRDYFIFHQQERSNVLRIGDPVRTRNSGKTAIQFTRRLDAGDGSFDGVVVVNAVPVYFAPSYDSSSLGNEGLLAMVGEDGGVRMAKIGKDNPTSVNSALNSIPPLGSARGAQFMNGTPWFADHKARFVAWEALKEYPFIAMVGLSEDELLAPYRQAWSTYRNNAVVGSIFLFLFALIAALLSLRLAWNKHQAEKAREAYWIASAGGNEGFYMWRALSDQSDANLDFEIVDCNERGASLYGLKRTELFGKKLSSLYSDFYFDKLMNTCRRAIEKGVYEDEYKLPPNSPLAVEWVHRKLVRTTDGLALTVKDITKEKAHERELVRLANEDVLTGLPNRHWLVNFLPDVLGRAQQTGTMLGLLFIDLDGFKKVNDTLGHSAGDELLQAAALRLKSAVGPIGNVVRFSGDEFIIILENLSQEIDAVRLAERVAAEFSQPFDLSRGRHIVAASVGIALYPRDGKDAETLLKSADMAMYSAKGSGKGNYRFYHAELYEKVKRQLDTEQQLLRAIEGDLFVMHYQPRIDAMTGEVVGMEALVRWQHQERGMVLPNDFIPLAEMTGTVIALGELVMEKVCAQLASWQKQGVRVVPISVNVSARQFNEGNIKNLISSCLTTYGIAAELIEIELTESVVVGDNEKVIQEIAAINAMGVKIHIDDFGTGYSSLSLLRKLNMDVLKVDRSFTSQLEEGKEGEIFFKAIISMAKALNMRVIAEGVENEKQLRILQSLSCDEIQGYFASRPLPANDIPPLLHKRFLLTQSTQ